jgi:hypothetical protein
MARTLIEEKTGLRNAELAASESHLGRLREGRVESIETSSLHLAMRRDLKRIRPHICSVAYPVLEATGELQPSSLRKANLGCWPPRKGHRWMPIPRRRDGPIVAITWLLPTRSQGVDLRAGGSIAPACGQIGWIFGFSRLSGMK